MKSLLMNSLCASVFLGLIGSVAYADYHMPPKANAVPMEMKKDDMVMPETVKPEAVKPEEVKKDEVCKPEDVKKEEVKPEEVKKPEDMLMEKHMHNPEEMKK